MIHRTSHRIALLAPVALLLLASISWAQRGGFSPEESFNRMDRNSDGVLTADETERLPSFMREEFTKQGLDFSRGVRRGDFERAAPKAFEAIRSRFSQSSGGFRGGPPDMSARGGDERRSEDDRRRDDERRREYERRREESSRGESRPAEPANRRVITKSDPVTIELQKEFQEGDVDQDGQIAFYEWRKWKPNDLAGFLKLDANGDGFVTPREIKFPTQEPAIASTSGTPVSTPVAATTTAPTPRMTTTPVSTVPAASGSGDIDRNSTQGKRAIYFFAQLDKNKDGKVVLEEWSSSRTIKPQFERGGVDLSKPLTEDEFIAHFVRLNERND